MLPCEVLQRCFFLQQSLYSYFVILHISQTQMCLCLSLFRLLVSKSHSLLSYDEMLSSMLFFGHLCYSFSSELSASWQAHHHSLHSILVIDSINRCASKLLFVWNGDAPNLKTAGGNGHRHGHIISQCQQQLPCFSHSCFFMAEVLPVCSPAYCISCSVIKSALRVAISSLKPHGAHHLSSFPQLWCP